MSTQNQTFESLDLFKTEDLISNREELLAIVMKSGEIDAGGGKQIRAAVAFAVQTEPQLITKRANDKDFQKIRDGQNVSFESMCKMLTALGLRFRIERQSQRTLLIDALSQ